MMSKAGTPAANQASSSIEPSSLDTTDPFRTQKVAYLERLKKLVLDEAHAERTRVHRIWSRTIPERVARAYCIEGLEIIDAKSSGDLRLSFTSNRSRFREGDILCLNRGDPRSQPNLLVTLEQDRDHELLVSPYYQDLTWANILEETQGWYLDIGFLDLSRYVLDVLNDTADSVIGREHILPLLMGIQKPKLDPSRIERGLGFGEIAELNWSQQEALAHAYATDSFYLIQGPPGTGKTRVLAHLAEVLVDEGERVLITAFTHRAINNALNTLDRFAPLTPVIKIGHPKQAADLDLENYPHFESSPMAEMSGGYAIGATPYATRTNRLSGVEFDTILIDEASQITTPLAIMAMLPGRRYIFIGDHQQLPPVLVSKPISSAFEHSVFGELVDRGFDTMLRTTYRLNQDLVSWPNVHFYEGLLEPDEAIVDRRITYARKPDAFQFTLAPTRSKVFIDVGHKNTTTFSKDEANTVADVIAALVDSGVPAHEIGVVTPYRAQAREIRSHIRCIPQIKNQVRKIVVDTVERMQGQERDVVILSLTTSNPAFALELADFFFQPQRINVAVTRARRKLIIIGSTHLFKIETEDEEIQKAISLLESLVDGCDYWVPDMEI
jgi:DNA replication ATP-dependent helicase Dna2